MALIQLDWTLKVKLETKQEKKLKRGVKLSFKIFMIGRWEEIYSTS